MPTYLTFIPGFKINAEINAPSTKQARTSYLDYLQRNNYIGWDQRQAYRKKVKTDRMEPGEIATTIQLDYDMQEGPPPILLGQERPNYVEEEEFEGEYVERAPQLQDQAMRRMEPGPRIDVVPQRPNMIPQRPSAEVQRPNVMQQRPTVEIPRPTPERVDTQMQLDVGRVSTTITSPIARVAQKLSVVGPNIRRVV